MYNLFSAYNWCWQNFHSRSNIRMHRQEETHEGRKNLFPLTSRYRSSISENGHLLLIMLIFKKKKKTLLHRWGEYRVHYRFTSTLKRIFITLRRALCFRTGFREQRKCTWFLSPVPYLKEGIYRLKRATNSSSQRHSKYCIWTTNWNYSSAYV